MKLFGSKKPLPADAKLAIKVEMIRITCLMSGERDLLKIQDIERRMGATLEEMMAKGFEPKLIMYSPKDSTPWMYFGKVPDDLRVEIAHNDVDVFLQNKGFSGLMAARESIDRASRENRMRHSGGRPCADEDCFVENGIWHLGGVDFKDGEQFLRRCYWLATYELGVPLDLRRRLIEKMRRRGLVPYGRI